MGYERDGILWGVREEWAPVGGRKIRLMSVFWQNMIVEDGGEADCPRLLWEGWECSIVAYRVVE